MLSVRGSLKSDYHHEAWENIQSHISDAHIHMDKSKKCKHGINERRVQNSNRADSHMHDFHSRPNRLHKMFPIIIAYFSDMWCINCWRSCR